MDVDRYLRNNLDDSDYAEAAAELEKPYQRIRELELEVTNYRALLFEWLGYMASYENSREAFKGFAGEVRKTLYKNEK